MNTTVFDYCTVTKRVRWEGRLTKGFVKQLMEKHFGCNVGNAELEQMDITIKPGLGHQAVSKMTLREFLARRSNEKPPTYIGISFRNMGSSGNMAKQVYGILNNKLTVENLPIFQKSDSRRHKNDISKRSIESGDMNISIQKGLDMFSPSNRRRSNEIIALHRLQDGEREEAYPKESKKKDYRHPPMKPSQKGKDFVRPQLKDNHRNSHGPIQNNSIDNYTDIHPRETNSEAFDLENHNLGQLNRNLSKGGVTVLSSEMASEYGNSQPLPQTIGKISTQPLTIKSAMSYSVSMNRLVIIHTCKSAKLLNNIVKLLPTHGVKVVPIILHNKVSCTDDESLELIINKETVLLLKVNDNLLQNLSLFIDALHQSNASEYISQKCRMERKGKDISIEPVTLDMYSYVMSHVLKERSAIQELLSVCGNGQGGEKDEVEMLGYIFFCFFKLRMSRIVRKYWSRITEEEMRGGSVKSITKEAE